MTFRPSLKQVVLVLLPALFVVTACQKEVSSTDVSQGCQLIKITYYDSARLADSSGIQYANGHVSRVSGVDLSYTFNYNNGRVTRLDYFEHGGIPAGLYDTIVYNGSGKIGSVQFFSNGLGAWLPIASYDLTYNGDGTVGKVTENYISTLTGNLVPAYEYYYTWSQSNITQVVTKDLDFMFTDTLTYTYDNSDNYYKKLSTEFIFTDHYLFGINGLRFGPFAAFLFSKNNVSTLENVPITYTKDSKGNITELKVATERLATYEYKCP